MENGVAVTGKEEAILDLESLILEKLDIMENIIYDSDADNKA